MYGNGTNKELFLDLETTGTNPELDGIVQIAGIIRIDGVVQEEFMWYMKPDSDMRVQKEAMDVNKLTLEFLEKEGITQREGYEKLLAILGKYIEKFDKTDKFFLKGWKVYFDLMFLSHWFVRQGDNYFFSWVHTLPWDVATYFITLFEENFDLLPTRLVQNTAADFLKIPYTEDKLHDALEDCRLSMNIYDKVKAYYPQRFLGKPAT